MPQNGSTFLAIVIGCTFAIGDIIYRDTPNGGVREPIATIPDIPAPYTIGSIPKEAAIGATIGTMIAIGFMNIIPMDITTTDAIMNAVGVERTLVMAAAMISPPWNTSRRLENATANASIIATEATFFTEPLNASHNPFRSRDL